MSKIINQPPAGDITVDKTEITLPDNKVTVDASKSYDPAKNGKVTRVEFYSKPAGVIFDAPIINDPNPYKTGATMPNEGDYVIGVNVYDRSSIKNTNVAEVTVKVNPAPQTVFTFYGVWGNGDNVTQQNIDALKGIRGWHLRIAWKDFSNARGVYNWAFIEDKIDLLIKNKLAYSIMIYVGDNSPQYIYQLGVPAVKTTTSEVFPFYKNELYQTLTQGMWTDFAAHIKAKGYKLECWQSAEGSTGDEGSATQGYKGDPIDGAFILTPDWWTNYRRGIWTFINNLKATITMVNPGNSDKYDDLAWAVNHILPDVWNKSGNSGHQFGKDGELIQVTRNWQFTENDNTHRVRTELEAVDQQDPTYTDSCATQQGFFALASNVDIFCISAMRARYLKGLKYFNDYAGQRNPNYTRKSFVYISGQIELTGLSAAQKNAYIAGGASTQQGFWYDDFGTNILAGNYERGAHLTGDWEIKYRVDTTGLGRYGAVIRNGIYTLDQRLMQPSRARIVYKDLVGSITVNGVQFKGNNTGNQIEQFVPLNGRSYNITTEIISGQPAIITHLLGTE